MSVRRWSVILAVMSLPAVAWAQDREVVSPGEPRVVVVSPLAPQRPMAGVVLQDQRAQMVTHPGAGAGGADISRLQSTSLGMNNYGNGVSSTTGYRIADDFTVPAGGWTLNDVSVYAYQTGSSTTSTFTGLNFRIWDGDPSLSGSNVVFGDTATNRMSSTGFANIYRDVESAPDVTNRPVMVVTASGLSVALAAGTYWLDWQATGSLSSGPWAVPITINGQSTTGNALQFNGTAWAAVTDVGPQGFPITLSGELPAADLGLAKVAVGATGVAVGGSFSYEITASNAGPGAGSDVVVTDSLPAEVTYVGNNCGASFVAPTLTWTIGNLANGASVTCTINVTVARTGAITNTAAIAATTTDPNPDNNSGTAAIAGAAVPGVPVPATSTWAMLALLAAIVGFGAWAVQQRR